MYTDDIKLFAKRKKKGTEQISKHHQNIQLEFGMEKCPQFEVKKRKLETPYVMKLLN